MVGTWRGLPDALAIATQCCVCARPAHHNIQPPTIDSCDRPPQRTFPPQRDFCLRPIHLAKLYTRHVQLIYPQFISPPSRLPLRDAPSTPQKYLDTDDTHNGRTEQSTRHRLSRMDSRRAPPVERRRARGAGRLWLLSAHRARVDQRAHERRPRQQEWPVCRAFLFQRVPCTDSLPDIISTCSRRPASYAARHPELHARRLPSPAR